MCVVVWSRPVRLRMVYPAADGMLFTEFIDVEEGRCCSRITLVEGNPRGLPGIASQGYYRGALTEPKCSGASVSGTRPSINAYYTTIQTTEIYTLHFTRLVIMIPGHRSEYCASGLALTQPGVNSIQCRGCRSCCNETPIP